MQLIVALIALLQPPVGSDLPSIESITAAWKRQAMLPANYSVTFRCCKLRLNEDAFDNARAVASLLSKQGNDITFQTVTDLLSNSGIRNQADPATIQPMKVKVQVKADSISNQIFQPIDSKERVASFCYHNGCMVFRSDANKTYDLYLGSRSLGLDNLRDVVFVPGGIENMVKINQEQSDRSKLHLDIVSEDGFGFYELDPATKFVKYFEANDKKRNSKRIVAQYGLKAYGTYSIPTCILDYSSSKKSVTLFFVESFAVDSVLDKDFVISYNKNWVIRDYRLDKESPALHQYNFTFDDVCNHMKAKQP